MKEYKNCNYKPLWCKFLDESGLFCTNDCITKNIIPVCEDDNDYRFMSGEINVAHVIVEKEKLFLGLIFIKIEQNELNNTKRTFQRVLNETDFRYLFKKNILSSIIKEFSGQLENMVKCDGFCLISKDIIYNKLSKFFKN